MASFSELGLSKEALEAVAALGYENPTPIQEAAIPVILAGDDVIAAASTGTGKTAAFLLTTVSTLEPLAKGPRAPRILVITPTRELAEQIAYTSYKICRACRQFTTVVFGGKPYGPQIRELRQGTDVLIATPGRLCDLIDRGVVNLGKIEVLVLDEADRMLDMGFLPDVKKIVDLVPNARQTLLFSATVDNGIKNNLEDLLKDPEFIQIAKRGETAKIVDQYVLPVAQKEKPELLKCLLDEKGYEKVIVFARTKARAENVAHMLEEAGYPVECIHSDKTQGQRKRALSNFRKGKANIIVATDVLARGIDVPSVDYVVNYDLPDMAEDYIHRIGRTGRAGEAGFAVSFVSPNSTKALAAIEALIAKQIPVMRINSYDIDMSILKSASRHNANRSAKAKGKGKKGKKPQAADYNYEGWGDLRNKKKSKKSSKKYDEAQTASSSGKQRSTKRPSKFAPGGNKHSDRFNSYRRQYKEETPEEKKARGKAAGRNRTPKRPKSSGDFRPGRYQRRSKGL